MSFGIAVLRMAESKKKFGGKSLKQLGVGVTWKSTDSDCLIKGFQNSMLKLNDALHDERQEQIEYHLPANVKYNEINELTGDPFKLANDIDYSNSIFLHFGPIIENVHCICCCKPMSCRFYKKQTELCATCRKKVFINTQLPLFIRIGIIEDIINLIEIGEIDAAYSYFVEIFDSVTNYSFVSKRAQSGVDFSILTQPLEEEEEEGTQRSNSSDTKPEEEEDEVIDITQEFVPQ